MPTVTRHNDRRRWEAALGINGNYGLDEMLKAGLVAVLPVIYNWANPNDKRYGRK